MLNFFQSYILSLNPNGPSASIDYFYNHYKNVYSGISLSLNRGVELRDNLEAAKASVVLGHRQVMAILKFSMSCATIKLWFMARTEIQPYAIDFYKLNDDGVTTTLIGTKTLNTRRAT